jgi:hypothetical protein
LIRKCREIPTNKELCGKLLHCQVFLVARFTVQAIVGAGRSRRKGAGRKDAFAAHPKLEANLQEILKDTLAGDPMNPDVVWTHLNASQIKEKLSTKGINITLPTVRIVVKKKLGQTKSPKAESSRKM